MAADQLPISTFEAWHNGEMLDVVSDQCHPLANRVCRDKKIHVPDRLSGALQLGANPRICEAFCVKAAGAPHTPQSVMCSV
jgi:hypothetical protein